MSLWRDEKYLRLLSPQLDHFAQKHQHTFNFRCPLCGDSERVKSKARGYVYPKSDLLMFKCHNCSVALPFSALLRRMSRFLYDQYILERLEEENPRKRETPKASPNVVASPPRASLQTTALPSLDTATDAGHPLHEVYQFAAGRMLPLDAIARLYGTVHARTWLLPLVGEEKLGTKERPKVSDGVPYLVQPLRLPNGEWYGAQLRTLARKDYLTFRWAAEPLKVFGLDVVDASKPLYVVEGPIDSLFLPNSIAACGAALQEAVRIAEDGNYISRTQPRVFVWDNEPRNKEVTRHIRTAIRMKESVVIWPRNYPKDINDMVRQGLDFQSTILKRTFSGLTAELEFSQWMK